MSTLYSFDGTYIFFFDCRSLNTKIRRMVISFQPNIKIEVLLNTCRKSNAQTKQFSFNVSASNVKNARISRWLDIFGDQL